MDSKYEKEFDNIILSLSEYNLPKVKIDKLKQSVIETHSVLKGILIFTDIDTFYNLFNNQLKLYLEFGERYTYKELILLCATVELAINTSTLIAFKKNDIRIDLKL